MTMTPMRTLADLGTVADRLAIAALLAALSASLAGSNAVKAAFSRFKAGSSVELDSIQ